MWVLGRLARDLADLFGRRDWSLWYLLTSAVLIQLGFWYLSTPGPTLLANQPRGILTAVLGIGWAIALFWIVPAALSAPLGLTRERLGLVVGDARFGLATVGLGGALAVPLIAIATVDPTLRATYPWPGSWAGQSPGNLVVWAGLYLLYYASFEFFYRGYLLRSLESILGLAPAIWIQALAATLIHAGKPFSEALAAFPASLIFALLAVRSRSLFYPIALHFLIGLSTDLFSLARQGLLFP